MGYSEGFNPIIAVIFIVVVTFACVGTAFWWLVR